jgi:hypothetical protein
MFLNEHVTRSQVADDGSLERRGRSLGMHVGFFAVL